MPLILGPVPEENNVTQESGRVSHLWFAWFNTVRDALVGKQGLVRSGAGDPNAAVTGFVGDLWTRTDGGAATTLYVKESGAGTTAGWVPK